MNDTGDSSRAAYEAISELDKEILHCPRCKSKEIIVTFGVSGIQTMIQVLKRPKEEEPYWIVQYDDPDIGIDDPQIVGCHSCNREYEYNPETDDWDEVGLLEGEDDEKA